MNPRVMLEEQLNIGFDGRDFSFNIQTHMIIVAFAVSMLTILAIVGYLILSRRRRRLEQSQVVRYADVKIELKATPAPSFLGI